MKVTTAREAKNRFGQLLDSAQRAPVSITKNGRVVTVMLSVDQYERLRGAAWDRLARAMDAVSTEATSRGLTDRTLEALLANES